MQNLHGMQEAPQLTDSQPELESEQTGESIEGYEVTADPTPDVVPMRANEPEPPLGQASRSVETRNLISTEEGAMADQDPDWESLVSSEAAGAAAAAFGSLSRSLNAPSSESGQTIDDLVRQLLRPMLKAWLDENLPRIVERAVQEEVERVARRGR